MKTKHDTTLRFRFDSLQEVQRYLEATPRVWRSRESESEGMTSKGWDLEAGWKGALKLARDGWRDGAQALKSALVRLPALDPAPDLVYDTDGIIADIGRVCAGVPECMMRPSPEAIEGHGRVITLAVAINASGGTNARSMANYGTAVARYIDELETQGHQVEVIAGLCSEVSKVRCCHTWKVKGAGDTVNLATIAFSIGHPAAFRRFGFALRERLPRELVREDSAYGYSRDMTLDDLVNPSPGTVILNGMKDADSIARTPEAALAFIGAQIEAVLADPEAASVAA